MHTNPRVLAAFIDTVRRALSVYQRRLEANKRRADARPPSQANAVIQERLAHQLASVRTARDLLPYILREETTD